MELFIKSLSMKGFSKHKQEAVYEFKRNNEVWGENEEGKSTIGDAIAWGFLNSDLNGVERSISHLKNLSSKYTIVKINYSIDDKEYELIRKSGYANDNGLFVDGTKTTTEKLLAEQFNCDKDLFLCLLNPNYFFSFTPKKSREFLNKYFKKIPKSEIMKEFSDYEIEILTKEKFNFNNPNISLAEKRDDISELEKDLIYTDGMIDSIDLSSIDNSTEKLKDETKLEKQINKLKSAIESILSRNLHTDISINEDEDVNEKKKLEIEIARTEAEKFIDTDQEKLNKLTSEYKNIRNEYKNVPIEKPMLENINILQNNVINLKNQYKELGNKINKINKNKTQCPKCGFLFLSTNEQILNELLNSLETIKNNGLTANHQLEEAINNNEKQKKKYIQEVNEYRKLKENEGKQISKQICHLQQITIKKEKAFQNNKNNKLAQLRNQIMLLDTKISAKEQAKAKEIKKIKEQNQNKTIELKNKLAQLEMELNQIQKYNNQIMLNQKLAKENKDKIARLKKKKEDTNNRISSLKLTIDIIKRFISAKVKLQSSFIKKHLNKAEIIFEKISKTSGEVKDVFEIHYEDKHLNMLSNSTRIRTGIEIRNMLSAISNLNLPMLIDNAESITHFDRPNCQLFQLIVKKDQPLSIISA
ncbi:AAA family ATPase [Clostridium botulinum]|uniref:AAA family ATPase n=1 Tax=Clostridium botulinum TaxID=1491 RepID=UPI00099C3428|nr:AAA family ATPase [Clostridium botulinum]MCC5439819.1 AAA family ATPase [Clostridium botulinum]NCI20830.1 AAA family ATPase [Clostridium botulinum]NCI35244.1 AAA family ATPase [Clostridium botulinum]NCI72164.1 AAA family ATPase [Clostridium botulinum]NDI38277.1 AAA family ATPase [Clostridium botulinum]